MERTAAGRLLLCTLIAWLVLAAIVIGRYGDEVLPIGYLVRPMLIVTAVAPLLGAVASLVPGQPVVAAAVLAALVGRASIVTVLLMAAVGIVVMLLRRRGRTLDLQRGVTALVVILFGLSVVRGVAATDLRDASTATSSERPGVYLVLLDGYPRLDSLAALGIDNTAFVGALEARGFEHYPDARSEHGYTALTLTAMLTGVDVQEVNWRAKTRALRNSWSLPVGFAAIEPPVGHVTIPGAPTLNAGGMNDFEADLIGESVLHLLPLGGDLVADGMRSRLDEAIDILASTDRTRVFAHLVAPHPPFLYRTDGSERGMAACWPGCHVVTNIIERLGITREQWAEGMRGNLAHLNARMLAAVDAIIARDPDATIVLFSDHGGRYSTFEREEWSRSFLAARTPGRPHLFADEPRPDAVFRLAAP